MHAGLANMRKLKCIYMDNFGKIVDSISRITGLPHYYKERKKVHKWIKEDYEIALYNGR